MLEGRQRVVAVAANVNWQTRDQKRVTLASLFCWDMLVGPLFVCFQSSLKRTLSHFQLKLSDSTFLPFTVGKMNHAEEANVSAAPHVVAEEASDHWREACSFECSTRSCELHSQDVPFLPRYVPYSWQFIYPRLHIICRCYFHFYVLINTNCSFRWID